MAKPPKGEQVPDLRGEIWLPFPPTPKGRPRLGRRGAFTPQKTVMAELNIRQYIAAHHLIPEPIPYPLSMVISFYFENITVCHHAKRPDLDNLGKLVLDALGPKITVTGGTRTQSKGILFNDDAQVCRLTLMKCCHPVKGIHIQWRTLGPLVDVGHPLDPRRK